MSNQPFDYHRYLASREWALLREQVRTRSGNVCEHCGLVRQQAVHHLTYERLGHEDLDDLMAVCNRCHEFLSGKTDQDPLRYWAAVTPAFAAPGSAAKHALIPFALPVEALARGSSVVRAALKTCAGPGCIWCTYVEPRWVNFLQDVYYVSESAFEPYTDSEGGA